MKTIEGEQSKMRLEGVADEKEDVEVENKEIVLETFLFLKVTIFSTASVFADFQT